MRTPAPRKRRARAPAGPRMAAGRRPSPKRKPSPFPWTRWEILAGSCSVLLLLYIGLCYEHFHAQVTHLYAHLGYASAQHLMGQRYLTGVGVQRDHRLAVHWFRRASRQGHPHASYNLALVKIQNNTLPEDDREVEELLAQAADQGLQEAKDLIGGLNRNLA